MICCASSTTGTTGTTGTIAGTTTGTVARHVAAFQSVTVPLRHAQVFHPQLWAGGLCGGTGINPTTAVCRDSSPFVIRFFPFLNDAWWRRRQHRRRSGLRPGLGRRQSNARHCRVGRVHHRRMLQPMGAVVVGACSARDAAAPRNMTATPTPHATRQKVRAPRGVDRVHHRVWQRRHGVPTARRRGHSGAAVVQASAITTCTAVKQRRPLLHVADVTKAAQFPRGAGRSYARSHGNHGQRIVCRHNAAAAAAAKHTGVGPIIHGGAVFTNCAHRLGHGLQRPPRFVRAGAHFLQLL